MDSGNSTSVSSDTGSIDLQRVCRNRLAVTACIAGQDSGASTFLSIVALDPDVRLFFGPTLLLLGIVRERAFIRFR